MCIVVTATASVIHLKRKTPTISDEGSLTNHTIKQNYYHISYANVGIKNHNKKYIIIAHNIINVTPSKNSFLSSLYRSTIELIISFILIRVLVITIIRIVVPLAIISIIITRSTLRISWSRNKRVFHMLVNRLNSPI